MPHVRLIPPSQYPRQYPSFLNALAAQILLCQQEGMTREQIASALVLRVSQVQEIEALFCEYMLHPSPRYRLRVFYGVNLFLASNRPKEARP